MSIRKIAIVGAGPAGLTLARLLLVSRVKASIDLSIFELDASETSRTDQGGTLDLHAKTGLAAIRKCELLDSFKKHARYEGQEMIMCDKNASPLVHIKSGPKTNPEFDRPEIDRVRLREILLDSVPKEHIRWGKHLREVTSDGKLKFDDTTEGPFDLVVGADGAWSKVRARLTDQKPIYSGVSGFEMDIKEPATKCPQLNERVGRGAFFSNTNGQCLNAQRLGTDGLKVRSWFKCPDGETAEMLKSQGQQGVLDALFKRYEGWDPQLLELLEQGDLDTLRQWTLFELPVPSKWEHQAGFTLIGDAASLATPFSGQGVNKAMKDGLELSELIEESLRSPWKPPLSDAVKKYEDKMFPRAEEFQRLTLRNKDGFFGSESLPEMLTKQVGNMTKSHPSRLVRLLSTRPMLAIIYGVFWVRQYLGARRRKQRERQAAKIAAT